jgi:hypothetical protein
MRPEDLPEDIDGNQDDNPYSQDSYLYPYRGQSYWPLKFWWGEREYWRHWKRVKRDTGRWPFWSAMYHLLFIVLIAINTILFIARRDSQDWSAGKSWLVGIGFALVWFAILVVGRDVIRSYEAKLYTEQEEEKKHYTHRS